MEDPDAIASAPASSCVAEDADLLERRLPSVRRMYIMAISMAKKRGSFLVWWFRHCGQSRLGSELL